MRVQFNFKTYLVEPLYRDDNLFLWDMGDAGQQRSDDQEVIYQAVNLTQDEGGEPTDLELEDDGGAGAARTRACSSKRPTRRRAGRDRGRRWRSLTTTTNGTT